VWTPMTRRCSTCGINYPTTIHVCRVCEQQTDLFSNAEPDSDWETHAQMVEAADFDLNPNALTDPGLLCWRVDQLEDAGWPVAEAWDLARRRDVDLHQAVDLIGRCDTFLAYSILV
jgi:hypothetical protein